MLNPQVSNPNDFKVVVFKNTTNFDFTHDMGCMYDSRPIFGMSGIPGIKSGESMHLPFHVGHRIAINLAKAVMNRQAPTSDAPGIPTGIVLWDDQALEKLKVSFLTDLYTETQPIRQTETDVLMAKVEELKKLMEEKGIATSVQPSAVISEAPNSENNVATPVAEVAPQEPKAPEGQQTPGAPKVYQDKAEVIAELEKRAIPHDKRQNKANLEKLLA